MRPGLRTTEFYITLIKALVGPTLMVLYATGSLQHEVPESDVVSAVDQIAGAIVTLVGLFVSGSAVKTYTEARTNSKAIEVQAGARAEPQADVIGFTTEEGYYEDDEDDEGDADADSLGFTLRG